ncbi:MAG: DUF2851 family protein [Chthoniobacteraceae bacterium]
MNLARRYGQLLEVAPGTLREDGARKGAAGLSELEIQAHWFAGDFGTEFVSVRGEKISVVQFGAWNREAGPDFAEAAISINGGEPFRGSIEIDTDAKDWERHGHATNPDYDSVILHACMRQEGKEFFTRTTRHRDVPRIILDLGMLKEAAPNPLPVAKAGRCSAPLRDLPVETLREILEAAAQYRMAQKSARLARMGKLHGADEALYQALAVTLGYKNNKLPFTLLSQRLPLKFLQQKKGDLDAILFGVAGFIGVTDFTKIDLETRSYLRNLWDRWWKLRIPFTRISLAPDAWRLSSTRPANHPQRRIAALARIVENWRKIRALSASGDVAAIGEFFESLSDEYWDHHFTLKSKKSGKRMALIGSTRVNDMLANVFYPLAMLSHPECWKKYVKLPAPLISSRVKIAAARLLSDENDKKTILKSAANQQGLLQIYEDFCMQDNSDCTQCRFPQQIAQWQ